MILDLRDDPGLTPVLGKYAAHLDHIRGFAAEAKSCKIDANLGTHGDVCEILLGEGREIDLNPGEVDVAAGTEFTRSEHLAADPVIELGKNLEMNDPVIDKDGVTLVNVVNQAVVVDVDGIKFLASCPANCELHDVTNLEWQFGGEISRANGWSLCVEKDAHGHVQLRSNRADGGHDLANPVMLGVTHVEAENICSRKDHLPKTLGRFRGWAKGADDFGFAQYCGHGKLMDGLLDSIGGI